MAWSFYARHLMYKSRLNKKLEDEINCSPAAILPQIITNGDATTYSSPGKRGNGQGGVVTTCLTLLQKPAFWLVFIFILTLFLTLIFIFQFRAACCAHYCGANAYFTLFSWLPSYFTENYPTAQVSICEFNLLCNQEMIFSGLGVQFRAEFSYYDHFPRGTVLVG